MVKKKMVKHRTAIWSNAERGRNGGQDQRWLLHIRQIDEWSGLGQRGNRADGDPGLADTAGSGRRDKPDIVTAQQRLDKPDLSFSPNKRRARDRLVTRFRVGLIWHGEGTGAVTPRWLKRYAAWPRLPLVTLKP